MEHRKRSSSASLSKWGLVHAWLAHDQGRGIVLRAEADALVVTAVNGTHGERSERVGLAEEISDAAWRAINGFVS